MNKSTQEQPIICHCDDLDYRDCDEYCVPDPATLHELAEKCCERNWIRWHKCNECEWSYTPVEGHTCKS